MTPVSGVGHAGAPEGAPPAGVMNTPRPHFVDCHGNAPAYQPSRDLAWLLAAIPLGAGARFTPGQLAALDVAVARTRPRPTKHKIDYRVSLPVLGRRYYFVFLAGKERRTNARISKDRQNTAWRLSLAYAILLSVIATGAMLAIIVLLYVVKSMAGIDLFEEHSILHGLLY